MKTENRAHRNGGKKSASTQSANIPKNAPGKTLSGEDLPVVTFQVSIGMIDEINNAIAQLKTLHNIMMSRIFTPEAHVRFTDEEIMGLMSLGDVSFGRLKRASDCLMEKICAA